MKTRLTSGIIQDLLAKDLKVDRDYVKVLSHIVDEKYGDFFIFVQLDTDKQFGVFTNDNDLTSVYELKECWSNKKSREEV